jgi:hypothetical protein
MLAGIEGNQGLRELGGDAHESVAPGEILGQRLVLLSLLLRDVPLLPFAMREKADLVYTRRTCQAEALLDAYDGMSGLLVGIGFIDGRRHIAPPAHATW